MQIEGWTLNMSNEHSNINKIKSTLPMILLIRSDFIAWWLMWIAQNENKNTFMCIFSVVSIKWGENKIHIKICIHITAHKLVQCVWNKVQFQNIRNIMFYSELFKFKKVRWLMQKMSVSKFMRWQNDDSVTGFQWFVRLVWKLTGLCIATWCNPFTKCSL